MNSLSQRQSNFIERSIERYGVGRFDMSRVDYKNCHTKVIIGCKYHGWFSISPSHHLEGYGGCKACMNDMRKKVIFNFGINDVLEGTLNPLYRACL